MSCAIGALISFAVVGLMLLIFALCRASAMGDALAVSIFEKEGAPRGDRLCDFIVWQHRTMYRAAKANAWLCGEGEQVAGGEIVGAAEAIRKTCCKPGRFCVDDEAACIDATIRWCADRFGYRCC